MGRIKLIGRRAESSRQKFLGFLWETLYVQDMFEIERFSDHEVALIKVNAWPDHY